MVYSLRQPNFAPPINTKNLKPSLGRVENYNHLLEIDI